MRRAARFIPTIALGAALLASGGCVVAAVAVGAAAAYGAVKYTDNEAYRDFKASLEDTWEATLPAMRENGWTVGDPTLTSATEGHIDFPEIKVNVEKQPGDFTRVRVRVGSFSNEENRRRSGLVLESIAKRLD